MTVIDTEKCATRNEMKVRLRKERSIKINFGCFLNIITDFNEPIETEQTYNK